MVDDVYPPATRLLPRWGLRAEFWVEGVGQDYGTDTNATGTYLYLSTDQVRFYPLDAPEHFAHAGGGGYRRWDHGPVAPAQPLPLEQIPPLVFSEVMRDVDLFVSVASVANDPTWADGGPQGRYRDYWTHWAFGEPSETAKRRQCSSVPSSDRRAAASPSFLVVRRPAHLQDPPGAATSSWSPTTSRHRARTGRGSRLAGRIFPFEATVSWRSSSAKLPPRRR